MGIERSPARKKRDAKRAQRARDARTWAGPVEVRKVGDPEPAEPPAAPVDRFARRVVPLEGPDNAAAG